MMQPLKYCRSDSNLTRCGECVQLAVSPQGLYLLQGMTDAGYLSMRYDSGADGTQWNRLSLSLNCQGQIQVFVLVYDTLPSESPLLQQTSTQQERIAWICKNAALTAYASDLLLYDLKGRYLRFYMAAVQAGDDFLFRSYEVSFPKQTFADYLPRIYQNNSVLERYLGILQSAYLETTRIIEAFPRRLDTDLSDEVALRKLARWVGADEWTTGLNRELTERLVKNAVWLHQRRGTRVALCRFLELLTDKTPTVIEAFEWETFVKNAKERHFYEEMYGTGNDGFTVLFEQEPEIGRERLKKLLQDFQPIGTVCRLIFLTDQAPVGGHCYLNVNSTLYTGESPALGSKTLRLGEIRLTSDSAELKQGE